MTDHIQVITTTERRETARTIASTLVERRLAGCVQIIGPIQSTYRWQGQVETAEEWLCLIKSREDLYEELEKAIRELHTYKVPEILATPVKAGSSQYLEWLTGSLKA